jgi:hypothetical protein
MYYITILCTECQVRFCRGLSHKDDDLRALKKGQETGDGSPPLGKGNGLYTMLANA